MCLSHEQEKPKRTRKGKSSATKARREPSAAKQRETAVKVSAGRQHHQSVKSSHKKKPATLATTAQHVYSSTSMDINAAAKDTALPTLPSSSDSAPLPSVPSTHQRKRSTSECSCTVHKNCNRKHRYVVSHDYHDHASSPSIDDILPMNDDNGYFDDEDAYQPTPAQVMPTVSTTTTRSSHPGSKFETFPYRLYRMIEDAHAEGNSDIIHFMPYGRAFIVEDHGKLVDKLLARYFHQSKYVSFQRQLNIYGFQKLTVGTDQGAYYNEWFLRGKPELLGCIKRVRVKGTGSKGAYDPDNEPDLYRIGPWLPEFDGRGIDVDLSIEKEAMITLSNHTLTSISSVTRGSQSDSKPSTHGPATVASTFDEKMTIPSKVAVPTDLEIETLMVAGDGPSIVTPSVGTRIFDETGSISLPPLPPVVPDGLDIMTSSGASPSINPNPPTVPETSDKATESLGFEPVPLKSGDKSNSTGSYFDWSAAGITSSASIPPSLHAFAQDCLSRQPSSFLFRSPSFTSLFDSSTADNKNAREVSASTKVSSVNATANVPSAEASQDLEDCEDCSSICSEESVQRFLESVFDNDLAEGKQSPHSSQPPTSIQVLEEQDPSKITVVDGSEIPYAEV